jgi:hypothetical protein
MKNQSVRTTVDIPANVYRRLKEKAVLQGHSTRELILQGIDLVLHQQQRPSPKRIRFPLIPSTGPKVKLTNEQIYEYVEFP